MKVVCRTYTVVRNGSPQDLRMQDLEHVVGLGTELVLLERIAAAGAGVNVDCWGRWVEREGDPDAAELLQILQDAREARNAKAIAGLRRDYPSLDEELEMDIIEQESEQIAADVAQCAEQAQVEGTAQASDAMVPEVDTESGRPVDAPKAPAEETGEASQSVESKAEEGCDDSAVAKEVDPAEDGLGQCEGQVDLEVSSVEEAMEDLESAAKVLASEVGTEPVAAGAQGGEESGVDPANEQAIETEPATMAEAGGEAECAHSSECQINDADNVEAMDADLAVTESVVDGPTTSVVVTEDADSMSHSVEVEGETGPAGCPTQTEAVSIAQADEALPADSEAVPAVEVDTMKQNVLEAGAGLLERYGEMPAFEVRAVDQIEEGFERLSAFFSAGAAQTWTQARRALEQAMDFAEQVVEVREQSARVLEQVKRLRREALTEAQQARTHCREVMDSRDEAWRALQRTTARVGEAEAQADRAAAEAQRAAQYCEQARESAHPPG